MGRRHLRSVSFGTGMGVDIISHTGRVQTGSSGWNEFLGAAAPECDGLASFPTTR